MILYMSEVSPTRLNVRESVRVVSRAEVSSDFWDLQVRVSVVLVTENNPEGVSSAVQSVRSQRFQDWELLVIDDGDGTGIDAALKFSDPRIKGFLNPKVGLSNARNAGLNVALSNIVLYLNDSETWDEGYLEKRFNAKQYNSLWLSSSVQMAI